MNKFHSVAKLSENISETPEGFLVCLGVAITRAGDLVYSPSETPVTAGDGPTIITRTIEDIHDPATIASFEGKPVTINHPDDFVTPDNWRELAVGVVQNARPGEGEDDDKLLADLLITDREAISAIKSKMLREVSCGYEAEYIEVSPGIGRQFNIIGNHVALVASGRCGSECAIFDHAPKKEEAPMTMKEKLLGIFGKAFDEAMPEEIPAKNVDPLDAIMKRLDAIEAANKPTDELPAEGEKPADELPAETSSVEARLATLEAAIAKLVGIEAGEGENETSLDAETVARAEILAPGLAKSKDMKAKSLETAYGTEDGKAIIDRLLAGKTFDSADKGMLFVAASEMLKSVRRTQLNAHVSLDSLPSMKAGDMTPEKINQMNAARYGKQ